MLTHPVTMRELSTADVLTAMIAGPRQDGAPQLRLGRRRAILTLQPDDQPRAIRRRAARVLALVPLDATTVGR
ncbi:MAG: hypothetical protein K8W52_35130 [Deltaproteobacteria bacterium]|nr:hypothetical protein [Deltaproteobacteria bacterium]